MSIGHYPAAAYAQNVDRWLDKAGPEAWQRGVCWYGQAADDIQEMAVRHGLPFGHMCGIVAVLSPFCRWERNILEAENVITGRRSAVFPANVRKAAYILAGEEPEEIVTGPKVTAFYRLLLSGGRDPWAICVDSIAILAATGIDPNPLVTSDDAAPVFNRPRQLETIRAAYRSVATNHQLLPCQAQAVVWTAWRNERDTNQ